jgi:diguanylate cyclase (GGDEF)-like protein
MALTLIKKWNLDTQARNYVLNLESEVDTRTQQLNKLLQKLESKNKLLTDTNERLAHVAVHDSLTDIPNRVLFNDRLKHTILLAKRENHFFAVCIMDLNKFKEINDNDGHIVGDQVLKEVATRIDSVFRKSDTVARLGGDEFALLLPKVPREAVPIVANKIIKTIEKPIVVDEQIYKVGVSIGFSLFPEHGEDNSILINCADFAMYKSKRNNIGYNIYDSEEDNKRLKCIQLIKDLEIAIKNNKLALNYQPIVDISAQKITGVEALCRWIHPEQGFIPPDQFIHLAEENELIVPLTDWVLKTAIHQCAQWNNAGQELVMSINFSAQNLMDKELPKKLQAQLAEAELDAKWIKIEITESMTMDNPERSLKMLKQFSNMGVKISIDDFGTGYSSLAYLTRLPVDELKIDRCFVLEMDNVSSNAVIVKSTIDLAHNLGLTVVAEGIERDSVIQMLKKYGCEHAQGFHICKSQSSEDLNIWLDESPWANGA